MKWIPRNCYWLILLLVIAVENTLTAQNLVPNPGFEKKSACPGPMSGLNLVEDWFSPTNTTPDYFNSCSVMPLITGVPLNSSGYQTAKDGDAYCGIIANSLNTPFMGEYLTTRLNDSLVGGLNYDISFNVSLAEINNYRLVAIDRLGAHLSKEPPTSTTTNLNIPYSIKNPSGKFLADTSYWENISGIYNAKGGEVYITIGCFDDESPVDTQQVTKNGVANACYYYVDVVSVSLSCDTVINKNRVNGCKKEAGVELTASHPSYMSNGVWNTGQIGSSITVNQTGTYWHRSNNGCYTIIDTFFVLPYSDSIALDYQVSLCTNKGAALLTSSIANAQSYSWNTGLTDREVSISSTGTYRCSALKDCTLYVEDFIVTIDSNAISIDLGPDRKFCKDLVAGTPLGLQQDSLRLKYLWSTGDTTCCINVTNPGSYILTAATECMEVRDTVHVDVTVDCNDCLFLPTAFSPNYDGLNDIFRPLTRCNVDNFSIRIYNRWGEQIFKSFEVNRGWDGLHGPSLADVGTYHYVVEYTSVETEKKHFRKGQVMLVR